MKTHKWNDIKHKNKSPERVAQLEAGARAHMLSMDLAELRHEAGLTQVEASAEAEMTQSQLSRFERGDDKLISSLRRYVKALGGELEIVAVLGNKRITLSGV